MVHSVESSTSIAAYSAYPDSAASPRVRITGFAPYLRDRGVDVDFRPSLTVPEYKLLESMASARAKASVLLRSTARVALRKPAGPDALVMIHRLLMMFALPGIDPPRRIDVYDFDDALFLGSILPVNRRFAWLKREAERWVRYVSSARLVLAGNSYLADRAYVWNKHVEVIPSCIDARGHSARAKGNSGLLTLGWIGSGSTSGYLKPAVQAFSDFNRNGLRARLLLIGAHTDFGVPGVETRPWSLLEEERALSEMDIGLMPLPDDPWTRGKCGYKLLRYFNAGVPAVASPVGVNSELVGAERGLLARTQKDWLASFRYLASDPLARREMGERGQAFVRREYSYERWAPEVARMLRALA